MRPLEQACKTLLNGILLASTAIKNLFQTNSARVSSRRMLCHAFPFVYSREWYEMRSLLTVLYCICVCVCVCVYPMLAQHSLLRSAFTRSHAYMLCCRTLSLRLAPCNGFECCCRRRRRRRLRCCCLVYIATSLIL